MSKQSKTPKFVITIDGKYVKGICVVMPKGKPMILFAEDVDLAIHFDSEWDACIFIRSLPISPCCAPIVEVYHGRT